MPKNKPTMLCCICGKAEADTRDHIPCKGVFPPPRPSNLITVPACRQCNGGGSSTDELFKFCIGMRATAKYKSKPQIWDETVKTFRHNKAIRLKMIKSIKKVFIPTASGLIYQNGYEIGFNNREWITVIRHETERYVRGLYFHHYHQILGDRISVSVTDKAEAIQYLLQDFNHTNTVCIHEDFFQYKHAVANDDDRASIWLFRYYNSYIIAATTLPKDENQKTTKSGLIYLPN